MMKTKGKLVITVVTQHMGKTMNTITIEPKALALLRKIYEGWKPPQEPKHKKVTTLTWGEQSLSELSGELLLSEGNFRIGGSLTRFGKTEELLNGNELWGNSLRGVLPDGFHFVAHHALCVCRGPKMDPVSKLIYEYAELYGINWEILSPTPAMFWIGRLEGLENDELGNFTTTAIINGDFCSSRRNFVLKGYYNYYLLYKEGWNFVVELEGSQSLDRKKLGLDFLALQFVFGQRMKLPMLCGMNPTGEVVGYMAGIDGGATEPGHVHPPLPRGSGSKPSFFACLSKTLQEQPELRLEIALSEYLDSLTGYLDFSDRVLQGALEGFAYWFLLTRGEANEIIVNDVEEWKQWVKEHAKEIRTHAKSNDLGDFLVARIKHAYKHASGRRVQDTFDHLGLKFTKKMREMTKGRKQGIDAGEDPLSGRDVSLHTRVMSLDGHDIIRDTQQIQLLRVMLIGLIARAVEYQGSISCFEYSWTDPQIIKELETWWTPDRDFLDKNSVHYKFADEEILEKQFLATARQSLHH